MPTNTVTFCRKSKNSWWNLPHTKKKNIKHHLHLDHLAAPRKNRRSQIPQEPQTSKVRSSRQLSLATCRLWYPSEFGLGRSCWLVWGLRLENRAMPGLLCVSRAGVLFGWFYHYVELCTSRPPNNDPFAAGNLHLICFQKEKWFGEKHVTKLSR